MKTPFRSASAIALSVAALFVATSAHAELRCDRVTPADVEKICGVKVHVVAGVGDDAGDKDCSRLLTADDVPGAKRGGVSIHMMKSANAITADPKWTDVKPVAGWDAAFSYGDEPTPGDKVTAVGASRGGITTFVTMVGNPICSVEQAAELAAIANPAPSAESRGTAFEASSTRPEMRDGGKLLVTAYAIIWLLVTGYLAYLWNKQRSLADRIDGLEAALDRAEAAKGSAKKKEAAKPAAEGKDKGTGKGKDEET